MKIGFIHNQRIDIHGGEEYQIQDLIRTAPSTVKAIPCMPGQMDKACDGYIVCGMAAGAQDADYRWLLEESKVPYVRRPHAWDSLVDKAFLRRVDEGAQRVLFKSPAHESIYQQMYGYELKNTQTIVPFVDVSALKRVVAPVERIGGLMWAGTYSPHKGTDLVLHWARREGFSVDYFGIGLTESGRGKWHTYKGQLGSREDAWKVMGSYSDLVFMPRAPEPFGIVLVEAWAAGAGIITNGRIGLKSYDKPIDEIVDMCEIGSASFWGAVEGAIE